MLLSLGLVSLAKNGPLRPLMHTVELKRIIQEKVLAIITTAGTLMIQMELGATPSTQIHVLSIAM